MLCVCVCVCVCVCYYCGIYLPLLAAWINLRGQPTRQSNSGSLSKGTTLPCLVFQLAFIIMTACLQVIEEEGLSENAAKMGEIFSRELKDLRPDIVLKMRGMGLFWAMVIDRKGGKQFKTRYLKVTIFAGIYVRYFCGLAQNCKILYPQTFTYMRYGSMGH